MTVALKPQNAVQLLEMDQQLLTTALDLLFTINQDLRGPDSRHFMSRCDCNTCQAARLILEEIELNESVQRIFRKNNES